MSTLRTISMILIILLVHGELISSEITSFFNKDNRCDYLIITPLFLSESAVRLAGYRDTCSTDDVGNAGYVILEKLYAQAPLQPCAPDSLLRASIIWARENWVEPPVYIVLLGDDSVKIRGDIATVMNRGPMPTHIDNGRIVLTPIDEVISRTDTVFNYSDDWFVKTCTDSTSVTCSPDNPCLVNCPDRPVAIGRIPCETPEQLDRYIRKVIRYEASRNMAPWRNRILLVADDRFEGNEFDNLDHASYVYASMKLLPGRFLRGLFLGDYTSKGPSAYAEARNTFFLQVNEGAAWTLWYAHGTPSQLTGEHILEVADYIRFDNVDRPTIMFTLGCSNGGFYVGEKYSMCKRFLFDADGGAVAYVANPNTTIYPYSFPFMRSVIEIADSLPRAGIGTICAHAKKTVCLSSLNSFEVFGDPALPGGIGATTLNMRINSNATVSISMENPFDRGTIAWEITRSTSQYDTLTRSDMVRDTVVYSGIKEYTGGSMTIALPSLPDSDLLQMTAFTWNGRHAARGTLDLYRKIRPQLPPSILCSYIPFPEDSVKAMRYFGNSQMIGVGYDGTIAIWSLHSSGNFMVQPIGLLQDASQVTVCPCSVSDAFLVLSRSISNGHDSCTLLKMNTAGAVEWTFNIALQYSGCRIEATADGGCVVWNSSDTASINFFRLDAHGNTTALLHLDSAIEGLAVCGDDGYIFTRTIATDDDTISSGTTLAVGMMGPEGGKKWDRHLVTQKITQNSNIYVLPNEQWIMMAPVTDNGESIHTLLLSGNNEGDTLWTETLAQVYPVSCNVDNGNIVLSGQIDNDGVAIFFDSNGKGLFTMTINGQAVMVLGSGPEPGRYLAASLSSDGILSPGILYGATALTSEIVTDCSRREERHQRFAVRINAVSTIVFSCSPSFTVGTVIDLIDLHGRRIKRIPVVTPVERVLLDGGTIAAGSYIVQVRLGRTTLHSQIVVRR